MHRSIDYYFSLVSPWAYIGHATSMNLTQRHSLDVNFKPVSREPTSRIGNITKQKIQFREAMSYSATLVPQTHASPLYFICRAIGLSWPDMSL